MNEAEFRYKDNTVHPRQAEILKNNYHLFITRASNSSDEKYRKECLDAAVAVSLEYEKITGEDMP